jgi:glycosyltransferase involved in cell wall biosynthesis
MLEPSHKTASLVVFSPLPPQRNGIADYVAALSPSLEQHYECIYVVSDDWTGDASNDKVNVIEETEYYNYYSDYQGIPHLYHIGNNEDHIHCLKGAMITPGVVVLHDLTLHYLYDRATIGRGSDVDYCHHLIRELGQPGRVLARQFELSGWRGQYMFHGARLSQQLVARSKSVIVHSSYGEAKIRAIRGAPPVHRIPHHASSYPVPARGAARHRLGLPQDELVFVSLGFVTQAKQVSLSLSVLGRIRHELPPFRFLIAGAEDAYMDLTAEIAAAGLADVTEQRGFVPEHQLVDYLAAADIVLNLRYPTSGETSGTLLRALSAGACTIISAVGAFDEFPDDCVAKIAWGANAADNLADTIMNLARSPDVRTSMGAKARDYVATHHSMENSAALYRAVIDAASERPATPWAVSGSWEFMTKAQRANDVGAGALPWFAPLLPSAGGNSRVVGISSDAGALGLALDGYDVQPWDPAASEEMEITRTFDLILHSIAGAGGRAGLGESCRSANRFLKFGGLMVIVSEPDNRSPATYESRAELATLLLECGFRLNEYIEPTAGRDSTDETPRLWAIRAAKITEFTPAPVRIQAFAR